MRWLILSCAIMSGCATTVDPAIDSERQAVALERVTLANRAFLSCVLGSAERWVESTEPAQVIADLALAKCSSEKENLQIFLHSYNRVYWDPSGTGGPAMQVATDATRKGMESFTSAARNLATEVVMERRMQKPTESRDG